MVPVRFTEFFDAVKNKFLNLFGLLRRGLLEQLEHLLELMHL